MKLFIPALVPVLATGFSFGRSLLTRPFIVHTPGYLIREQEALMKPLFPTSSSPRYEITDTNEKFHIAVDVPGVKASDLNVTIEDGMLTLSGERKEEKDNYSFASKFYQSFSLDPAIETDKFQAELKNGVLQVSAPKNVEKVEEKIQKIPINELSAGDPVTVGDERETHEEKVEEKVEVKEKIAA